MKIQNRCSTHTPKTPHKHQSEFICSIRSDRRYFKAWQMLVFLFFFKTVAISYTRTPQLIGVFLYEQNLFLKILFHIETVIKAVLLQN